MKVLFDQDSYLMPRLAFPGDSGYEDDHCPSYEVPDEVSARWRDTRDAWWSMVREVEAFQDARKAAR